MIRRLMALVLFAAGLVVAAQSPAQAQITRSTVYWGPLFHVSHYTFTQSTTRNFYSSNGVMRFSIQKDGNLVAYKHFTNGGDQWRPYWTSYTNKKGHALYVQSNGALTQKNSKGKTVWSNKKAPGAGYNYALYLDNSGNLIEYYSHGDPRKSGRHVAWSIGRTVTDTPHVCTRGPVTAASTDNPTAVTTIRFPAQGGAGIKVEVDNHSYVYGSAVTVVRWNGKLGEGGRKSYVIGQRSSHTFSNYYGDDNFPETIELHIKTTSGNPSVGYNVTARCWYSH